MVPMRIILARLGVLAWSTLIATCVAALLAFAATGCGGPSKAQKAQKCQSQIGAFVDALEELNSRLSVGLSFSDYSEKVGTVRVAYDKITPRELDPDCLDAAGAGESAMNSYVTAYNTWNDCIGSDSCTTDSIDSDLQQDWAEAIPKVKQARSRLEAVGSG
jgi:hypothetical protein